MQIRLSLLIVFLAWQSIRARKQFAGVWIWASALVLLVIFQALLGMWTVTMRLNPLVVMSHLLGGIAILSILWWLNLKCSNLQHVQVSPTIADSQLYNCDCVNCTNSLRWLDKC